MASNSLARRQSVGHATLSLLMSIEHMAKDAKKIAEVRYMVEGITAGIPGVNRVPVEQLRRRVIDVGIFNLEVMRSTVDFHQKMVAIEQERQLSTALVMAAGVLIHELQNQLEELENLVCNDGPHRGGLSPRGQDDSMPMLLNG